MYASLQGIEIVYPKSNVSNDDLAKEFPDYNFEQFEKKVGIRSRYITNQNETGLDLAIEACEKLFTRFDKSSVDFICYCTQSPDYILPNNAGILQDQLGLNKTIGAFDFNLGCSGYTYGLSMAKALIESGQAKNVLLITAETYSKFLHPKDRSNRSIFGDAATASFIGQTGVKGIGNFVFGTDGSGHQKLIIKNGGVRYPMVSNAPEKPIGSGSFYSDNNLLMEGPDIFNFTLKLVPELTSQVMMKNGISEVSEIDQFILHQANSFMLETLRRQINLEKEKFFIDLKDGGNTVSSTIPIALKKYTANLASTEKIVVLGFGVGLSWCGGMLTIENKL
jgi:3-oxoacyl-[acyl-carrier-protein] synthase-3